MYYLIGRRYDGRWVSKTESESIASIRALEYMIKRSPGKSGFSELRVVKDTDILNFDMAGWQGNVKLRD